MAAAAAKAMTPTSRSKSQGFTLLELLLVLGIIALAAALIAPNLGGVAARSFSAQMREVGAHLNYSRRNAVVSGQTSVLTLGGAESDMQGSQNDARNYWHSSTIALAYSEDSVDVTNYAFRDSDFEETPQIQVSFYPEGGSSGGTIAFMQDDERAWAIIDSITGRVTVTRDEAAN